MLFHRFLDMDIVCVFLHIVSTAKLAGSESVDLVEVLNSEQVPSLARQHLSVMLELAQLLKQVPTGFYRVFLDFIELYWF